MSIFTKQWLIPSIQDRSTLIILRHLLLHCPTSYYSSTHSIESMNIQVHILSHVNTLLKVQLTRHGYINSYSKRAKSPLPAIETTLLRYILPIFAFKKTKLLLISNASGPKAALDGVARNTVGSVQKSEVRFFLERLFGFLSYRRLLAQESQKSSGLGASAALPPETASSLEVSLRSLVSRRYVSSVISSYGICLYG